MNKKDIALTVGGVLATTLVSYMIYRLEQRNNANAARSQADIATASYNASLAAQAGSTSFPSISIPQSSSTPVTSLPSTDYNTTSSDQILSQIIAAFQSTSNPATSTNSPSGMIQALPLQVSAPIISITPQTVTEPNSTVKPWHITNTVQ